tara:strand:- start:503 stop:1612 length:1110 start_codon:yes stop_codon:yes gene_type:complete
MATFEEQVEGLTSIAITGSSAPSQDELTEFLKDGVIDVTNKWITVKSQDAFNFLRSSSESTSQGGLSNSDGKIISVVRESGTNDDWRKCTSGSISLQSRYTDVDSLHFASGYNPKYAIGGDGSILVFPAPASGGANSYKVYYINSTPVNSSDATLIHSHSDINYFPLDKVYLVVLYASMKSLYAAMGALHGNSDISTALTYLKAALDQAEASTNKFESATGSIFGDADTFDTAASQITRVKAALNRAGAAIDTGFATDETSGSGDDATPKSAGYWLDDEDPEMVQVTIQTAQTEIQNAQAEIGHWSAIGDARVKQIQSSLQEADGYAKEVQTRSANLQQEYAWYDGRYRELKAEYDQAFMVGSPPKQGA